MDTDVKKWGKVLKETLMGKKIVKINAKEHSNTFTLVFDDDSTLEVSASYNIRTIRGDGFEYYDVDVRLNNKELFSTAGGMWYPD
ncbi:MAG: hypothetical protein AAB648_00260 [Patescibacteria group bacterium]